MNVSAPFIRRPVGTSLLAVAVLMAGSIELPVTTNVPMPSVRIARSPRQVEKSTTASAIDKMCPIFFTVALSFLLA